MTEYTDHSGVAHMVPVESRRELVDTTLSVAAEQTPATVYGYGESQGRNGAIEALRAAQGTMRNALRTAEASAANHHVTPSGRQENVEATASDMAGKVDAQLRVASAHMEIARKELTEKALPKLSKDDRMAGQHHLEAVLNASKDKRQAVMDLAVKGGPAAAAIFDTFGQDLLTAHGVDSAILGAAKDLAVNAAVDSPVPSRAKAAKEYQELNKLQKALEATRMSAHSAGTYFDGLAKRAGYDSRDAELRRLRGLVAKQNHHAA